MSRSWGGRPPLLGIPRLSESGDWKFIYQIGKQCDRWPRNADDSLMYSGDSMRPPEIIETLVVERSGSLCGYIVWGVHHRWDEAEVISMAVDSVFRRDGYGTRLLWRVGSHSAVRGFRVLVAIVNERDSCAISFFRSTGMRAVSVLRGRFGDEDGYRFEISLGGSK